MPLVAKVWCEFMHKFVEQEVFFHSTRITGKGRGNVGRGQRVR